MPITIRHLFFVLLAALGCTDSAHEQAVERSQSSAAHSSPAQEATVSAQTPQSEKANPIQPEQEQAVGSHDAKQAGKSTAQAASQPETKGKHGDANLEARVAERLKNYERMLAEEGISLTEKEREMHRNSIREDERNSAALKNSKMDIPMGADLDRQLNEAVGTQGPDAPQMGVRAR